MSVLGMFVAELVPSEDRMTLRSRIATQADNVIVGSQACAACAACD